MCGRLFEADHEGAQIRQPQPVRDCPPEDTALFEQPSPFGGTSALAGHDENHEMALRLGAVEKASQRVVSLGLAHAVEVDHGLDRMRAAR